MLWSQRLTVHLIRQEHIRREGFLNRDGAAKMHRLPLESGLIEAGERDVTRLRPRADGPQDLRQGNAAPVGRADDVTAPGQFAGNRPYGHELTPPIARTLQSCRHGACWSHGPKIVQRELAWPLDQTGKA